MDRESVTLPITESYALYKRGALILDVRLAFERQIHGAVPNAQELPLPWVQRFRGDPPDQDFEVFSIRDVTPEEQTTFLRWLLAHHAKATTILCFCAHGNRSVVAASILREMGYPHAYSVEGGMSAWKEHGFPVEEVTDTESTENPERDSAFSLTY